MYIFKKQITRSCAVRELDQGFFRSFEQMLMMILTKNLTFLSNVKDREKC